MVMVWEVELVMIVEVEQEVEVVRVVEQEVEVVRVVVVVVVAMVIHVLVAKRTGCSMEVLAGMNPKACKSRMLCYSLQRVS
jgi:hypothetical protein